MSKMATYPGMSLGGEVRENISLDEDDLSDVEDEVFIRDGKNSYKLAEELNVKRPLMAPRRKLGKPDITTRLKAKPPCKAFCKPCCYIFAALSVLIGLIALVVILVSIFPLPLNNLRDWVVAKAKPMTNPTKLLPCSLLKVTDVWTTNLPVLTTDSPIRSLDINRDGVEDIIFGFGTGDNYNVIPPDIFCPTFMGVAPPCAGGVIALNGINGNILWRRWLNDTIFMLQCAADLNGDDVEDCVAVGVKGTIATINSKDGAIIWRKNHNKKDVFVATLIPDQNNDSIVDILSSHTSLADNLGHLVLISGRSGEELGRVATPNNTRTFFMPQLLRSKHSDFWVIYGTGGPTTGGNLSVASLDAVIAGNLSSRTIYQDLYKGILTQVVLVDLTGDTIPDIVAAMANSTVVAIDGVSFQQLWNYTVANSETNVMPTPGYFNDDNITDFLIVYQKYDNILNYNYTKTFIIDGKSGKPIYSKPISGSVPSQMGGLTLGMESNGFDMFLFWTTECTNSEMYTQSKVGAKKDDPDGAIDVCRRQFNSTTIMKLNALNQYDQPPGFEIYNSMNRTKLEFNNTKSPMKQIREYFSKHPKISFGNNDAGQSEVDDLYLDNPQKIRVHKYGSSSFRHKDNRQEILKDYPENSPSMNEGLESDRYESDFDWPSNSMNSLPGESDDVYNQYPIDETDGARLMNQKQMLFSEPSTKNSRDPRSKEGSSDKSAKPSKKKNLSDSKYGIYDFKNIKMAKNRLAHDLNNLPSEILRDTYFKNRENQLRKSKFEQRDINSHIDKMKENEEVMQIIENEKKAAENTSYNLWDMESEKEMEEKESGYWRGKREANYTFNGIRRISSIGTIAKSLNETNSTGKSLDIIFIVYWQPMKISEREMLETEINDCIEEKLSNISEDQAHSYQKTTEEEQKALYRKECLTEQENLKNDFRFYNEINNLRLGQMTVYRIRVECLCDIQRPGERCAKFLPQNMQSWSSFLGKLGDGVFETRN